MIEKSVKSIESKKGETPKSAISNKFINEESETFEFAGQLNLDLKTHSAISKKETKMSEISVALEIVNKQLPATIQQTNPYEDIS